MAGISSLRPASSGDSGPLNGRGESLFGILQAFVFPSLRNHRQVAFELRDGASVVVAIVRRFSRADLPENAVALPLQARQFFALGLDAAFADEDISPVLEGKLLPARIRRQRKIHPAAVLPFPGIERRDFTSGPFVALLGLESESFAGPACARCLSRCCGPGHR